MIGQSIIAIQIEDTEMYNCMFIGGFMPTINAKVEEEIFKLMKKHKSKCFELSIEKLKELSNYTIHTNAKGTHCPITGKLYVKHDMACDLIRVYKNYFWHSLSKSNLQLIHN